MNMTEASNVIDCLAQELQEHGFTLIPSIDVDSAVENSEVLLEHTVNFAGIPGYPEYGSVCVYAEFDPDKDGFEEQFLALYDRGKLAELPFTAIDLVPSKLPEAKRRLMESLKAHLVAVEPQFRMQLEFDAEYMAQLLLQVAEEQYELDTLHARTTLPAEWLSDWQPPLVAVNQSCRLPIKFGDDGLKYWLSAESLARVLAVVAETNNVPVLEFHSRSIYP